VGVYLHPGESWTPNSAADVWTFKIRQGVTFHDGSPLTADDVVYTTSIGVTIQLTVESPSAYYGKATFGNSDWLDATMSLVNYGHRSVPNVFLSAPLQTTNAATGTGSWNAAHFNDTQYDTLSQQYTAAVDLSTQRSLAGQIQTLLLDQTPIIYGYFYDHLTATAANVTGVYSTAMGGLFLNNAVKT